MTFSLATKHSTTELILHCITYTTLMLGAQDRIRTYSPERTDLQSAATLQLSRMCVVYSKVL